MNRTAHSSTTKKVSFQQRFHVNSAATTYILDCVLLCKRTLDVALDISDGLAEFIKAGHCKPGNTLVALTGLAPDQPTVVLCALMSYHLKSPDKVGFMMMSFEPCPGAFFPFDARPSTTAAAHGFSAFTSHTHFGLAKLLARQAEGKLDFSWTI